MSSMKNPNQPASTSACHSTAVPTRTSARTSPLPTMNWARLMARQATGTLWRGTSWALAAMLLGCVASPAVRNPVALQAPGEPDAQGRSYGDPDHGDPDADADHTVGEAFLLYLPNRLLDLFDIVRARVRLGPGAAIDVRCTQLINVFAGSYQSYYLGIPGPRNRSMVKWPAGEESWRGIGVTQAEDSVDEVWEGPDYGPGEIGVGVHVLLIGADVGVDPLEAVDFVLGLFTVDFRDDDL